jgi:hypothetical protein
MKNGVLPRYLGSIEDTVYELAYYTRSFHYYIKMQCSILFRRLKILGGRGVAPIRSVAALMIFARPSKGTSTQ